MNLGPALECKVSVGFTMLGDTHFHMSPTAVFLTPGRNGMVEQVTFSWKGFFYK